MIGSMTVLAPLVLWALGIFLAEDWTLLQSTAPQFALALVGLVLVTIVWTTIGTFVSAAAASANGATVLWSVLVMGSFAVAAMLAAVLRLEWLRSSLSLWGAGDCLVRSIGGLPQRNVSTPGAVILLAGLLVLAWWRARRRLRLEDAVA